MLQSIQLTNFKSFREGRIPLSPFTILLGANGAGKSNVFDALRLLRFLATGTSVRDALEGHATPDPTGVTVPGIRGGAQSVPNFAEPTSRFRIAAEIRARGEVITYAIEIDASSYRVVNEVLSSKQHPGEYVFTTEGDRPASTDPDAPAISAQYYTKAPGRNPSRDFSPSSSILSQFEGRRAHSNLNEDVAELARSELAAIRPLELLPEVLRQYSPISVFELGEHGENFAAVAWLTTAFASQHDGPPAATEQLAAIKAWLSELTPRQVTDIDVVRAPTGEGLFAVRESPMDQLVTARSLSDGTLRFAALAFALFGSVPDPDTGAISWEPPDPPPPRTLLIEELENGINPLRLQLLVRMIESAAQPGGSQIQVIATTHSPSLLNWASDRTIENTVVIGWDSTRNTSRPVRLRDLPAFEDIKSKTTVGELQSEGWIELAADRP